MFSFNAFSSAAAAAIQKVSFKDVLDPDFYETTGGQFDIKQALVTMAIALGLGVLIAIVYKMTFSGVIYSHSFDVSLVLMTVITSVIIITISSNAVLSLGMVGALSIVRFRAAIKDPVDIMYLFWAISIGIVLGARQYLFAVIASVIIALICIASKLLRAGSETYLLVTRYYPSFSDQMDKIMDSIGAKVRNKTATADVVELTAELPSRRLPDKLAEKLTGYSGVISAVLVSYNGEYCE